MASDSGKSLRFGVRLSWSQPKLLAGECCDQLFQ